MLKYLNLVYNHKHETKFLTQVALVINQGLALVLPSGKLILKKSINSFCDSTAYIIKELVVLVSSGAMGFVMSRS